MFGKFNLKSLYSGPCSVSIARVVASIRQTEALTLVIFFVFVV